VAGNSDQRARWLESRDILSRQRSVYDYGSGENQRDRTGKLGSETHICLC